MEAATTTRDGGIPVSQPSSVGPRAVMGRLWDAQNRHDLEAFMACFAPDYLSEQPVHPARTFRGSEQVRQNWGQVFSGMPDFHAELLAATEDGETAWSEWRWTGTHAGGSSFHWRGVTL